MNTCAPFLLVLAGWLFATAPLAYAQSVKAETGGVAIGGNVRDTTIINGVPHEKVEELVRERTRSLEELTATQRDAIGLLKDQLNLNERQVRAALDIVGEANIPPEQLSQKLVEIAKRFKDLQAIATAQAGDDAKITALKAEAKKAVDAGELERADSLLTEVATEQRRALTEQARAHDRLAVNTAETLAQLGEIALTRLRYADAADHFAGAVAIFPADSIRAEKMIEYLDREADALFRQGYEFGDNPALSLSIDRYRQLITLWPQERAPLQWAAAQNNLGIALTRLGERESGTARLEQAVAAYRDTLKEYTRERVPLDWAMTQNNLGIALARLGERVSGNARLEAAVNAYRDALKEHTRERVPLQWATTQNNLGAALLRLGERERDTGRLEEAVTAYRDALKERTRERVPFDWAMTQTNLGAALATLGERESSTPRLEEAVTVFREALKVRTRERVPLGWAMTQNNLGTTLLSLAERERGTARLEEAVAAFRDALKEHTRERVPLDWAMTQNNLGNALARLGQRGSNSARLEEAVAAYGDALKEYTRERVPLQWATSTGNQGVALMLLAERHRDPRMAQTAVQQIEAAFATLREAGFGPRAEVYEAQLPKARALFARLIGR